MLANVIKDGLVAWLCYDMTIDVMLLQGNGFAW